MFPSKIRIAAVLQVSTPNTTDRIDKPWAIRGIGRSDKGEPRRRQSGLTLYSLVSNCSNCADTWSNPRSTAVCLAERTIAESIGHSSLCVRTYSRIKRRTRLREGALPSRFGTRKHQRLDTPGVGKRCIPICSPSRRSPERSACRIRVPSDRRQPLAKLLSFVRYGKFVSALAASSR